ncbi:MAG: 2OG-Fe(II) oxygenase [Chlamydiae bacterium]|nr:2OG-Fe(II) oxygenase [Chlamydiota bacterium]
MEKLSDSPLVYSCDQFLTDEECDHLIQLSLPFLTRSAVMNDNNSGRAVHTDRTSSGAYIYPDMQDEVVKSIQKRIAEITSIPEAHGELMNVLHYDIGQEYKPHFDYFNPEMLSRLERCNRGGQRIATFIIYLNTPEEGGETIFPKAELKITPAKGKALLFYNVTESGAVDPESLHGGAPVIKGEKWIVTRWLRNCPGIFL